MQTIVSLFQFFFYSLSIIEADRRVSLKDFTIRFPFNRDKILSNPREIRDYISPEKVVILLFQTFSKSYVMKKFAFPLVVFVGCLTASCSEILTATFEDDAINSPPATDLPGSPRGDIIQFNPVMQPQLKVQNSDISGSKALHYTHVSIEDPPPVSDQWLSFRGIGTDLTETLWFRHTAENMGATILIDLSDGHVHLMARMRIKSDGEVGLATVINDQYSDVIGNLASGVHTVIFTAFPGTLRYNVSIIQESGPTITASNKPMITDNVLRFNNPAHPMLSFLHSGSLGNTYAIGSVSISRREP